MADLPGGLTNARQADRRPGRAGEGRRLSRAGDGAADTGTSRRGAVSASGARRRARLAPPRPRAAPDAPVALGFAVFFLYPLVADRVPLVHQVRPAVPAAVGRPRQLPVHASDDPQRVAGDQEHPVDGRGLGARAGALRASARRCCSPVRARRRALPHDLLPARAGARRWPRRSPSSTCSTRAPGRSTSSSAQARHRRARSGSIAAWAKPSLVLLAIWGVGDVMVIFLAAVLDVPRQLYEAGRARRRRTRGSGSAM